MPVDVFEIDMAGPRGPDMAVFGQVDRFADALDRIDKGPGFFGNLCLCGVQILNAVPVDLGRADAGCQGEVPLDGLFFVKRDPLEMTRRELWNLLSNIDGVVFSPKSDETINSFFKSQNNCTFKPGRKRG